MLALYNTERGRLPEAKQLTKERERKCRARLQNNNGVFLEDFAKAVQWAAQLEFCRGGAEGTGWKASFDWLIANDTNYLKVLEGKYGVPTVGSPCRCGQHSTIEAHDAEVAQKQREIFGR